MFVSWLGTTLKIICIIKCHQNQSLMQCSTDKIQVLEIFFSVSFLNHFNCLKRCRKTLLLPLCLLLPDSYVSNNVDDAHLMSISFTLLEIRQSTMSFTKTDQCSYRTSLVEKRSKQLFFSTKMPLPLTCKEEEKYPDTAIILWLCLCKHC